MLDTSVRFPTHEVNLNNCRLSLRCPSGSLGDGTRPTDAALASFASHGDEPTDSPTFTPVRDTLAEIAPTPAAVGTCCATNSHDWLGRPLGYCAECGEALEVGNG